MEIIAPYKRKVRKLEFSNHKTESSSEESAKLSKEKYKDSRENSDSNQHKKKCEPYEEINSEFKKIKPLICNREIEKGEEEKAWISGMKKYFQIYNYSHKLK